MTLGTIIRIPDGRIGTICWHHLDGYGGIWGEHDFTGVDAGFNDELPPPEFMLRNKDVEELLRKRHPDDEYRSQLVGIDIRYKSHRADLECVGEDYEIIGTIDLTKPEVK